MPDLFKELTLAVIIVGLGSALLVAMSGLELTEADKESLKSLDLAGCSYDSKTGVWCPPQEKLAR